MTKREIYRRALQKHGATIGSVAARFGVSKQAVSQSINAEVTAQRRRRGAAKRRRLDGRAKVQCSACEGFGHNSTHCTGRGIKCPCGAVNPRGLWAVRDGSRRCPRCGHSLKRIARKA